MKFKSLFLKNVRNLILLSTSIVLIVPIWFLFVSSFRETSNILSYPPKLWPDDGSFQNYMILFQGDQYNYLRWFVNSLIFSGVGTLLVLLVCSMAGYAFAKRDFIGKKIIFSAILATLMVPAIITMIPTFLIVDRLGLVNTYVGLIAPTVPNAFGVFLMTQFIRVIPADLEESARLDGCGEFKTFWLIILPVVVPALSVLAIFNLLTSWSNLLWPLLVITGEDLKTLTVGIAGMKVIGSNTSGEIMAASFLSFIPLFIMFMFARDKFIEGATAGAVKG